jgi:hypothetical protein
MAKKAKKNTAVEEASLAMRTANWKAKRDAMAEGRRLRASTFADRRKVANRRACRDRSLWA